MINSTPVRKSGQKGKTMDCDKTIDFFAEAKRLCDSRAGLCDSRTAGMADVANKEQCPLFDFCFGESSITTRDIEEIIKAIEILQKWSDEYPKKTYAQDFFEKFPKAQSCSDGTPFVCRKRIYGGIPSTLENCDYTGACYKCWNEPLNDE